MAPEQMHLISFFSPSGRLTHSWRRAGSRIEEYGSLGWARHSAALSEEAGFDALFFADRPTHRETGLNPDLCGYEPLTTLGALSAVTSRIGLVATVSTSYTDPYNVARMLAQLDHLSEGRIGWNIVTSSIGSENFTSRYPEKAERYAIAEDHVRACIALWDAWEDDAVVVDREAGEWARLDRIHDADHHGEYFQVQGAFPTPRSPQGRPVLVQAGQSDAGIDFGSRYAELVFTSKNDLGLAQAFRERMRQATVAAGRGPDAQRVLPGLVPIIGGTRAEADAILDELGDLYRIDLALVELSEMLQNIDLTDLPLDEPIPDERLVDPATVTASENAYASRYENLHRQIVAERPTLREIIRTRTKQRAHAFMVGTAVDVADEMEAWFRGGACDGFVIIPAYMPEGLERVCDSLIPELQRRGLFRREYPGTTLRDTLGLLRP